MVPSRPAPEHPPRVPACPPATGAAAPGPSAPGPSAHGPAAHEPAAHEPAAHGAAAAEAARVLAGRTGIAAHDAAIVLGSGWSPAAERIVAADPSPVRIPMAELPGFAPPAAEGHSGTVISARVPARHGDRRVLVLLGRTHPYEGHPLDRVVHPVRTACAAGARTVVLTNAAGGLRPEMRVGVPVLISDHLNLTFRSPLAGPQFVDLTDAYDPALRALCTELDPALAEGVYACMPGPQYETPAEIRMLRAIGADLVGMSTVHETIAARAAGARVLGISLVTNAAAGMTGEPLDHEEVLAAGAAAAERMGTLLREVAGRL